MRSGIGDRTVYIGTSHFKRGSAEAAATVCTLSLEDSKIGSIRKYHSAPRQGTRECALLSQQAPRGVPKTFGSNGVTPGHSITAADLADVLRTDQRLIRQSTQTTFNARRSQPLAPLDRPLASVTEPLPCTRPVAMEIRVSVGRDTKKVSNFQGKGSASSESIMRRHSGERRTSESILPVVANFKQNYFRPNGLRQTQRISSNGGSVAPVAMGTNWQGTNNSSRGPRNFSSCNGTSSPPHATPDVPLRRGSSHDITCLSISSPVCSTISPAQQNASTPQKFAPRTGFFPSKNPTASSSREHGDLRYVDPTGNAPMGYIQRIAEIVALEAETIKWEKMRKAKRKFKSSES